MKPLQINFCHRYHKLNSDRFTTIRGKSWFKKVKVGDVAMCHAPGEKDFKVLVLDTWLETINRIEVEFLKADAEYDGFTLNSHAEFVSLLNSFRAPAWKKASETDEVTILTLTRLKP